jgi:hypothetical protein
LGLITAINLVGELRDRARHDGASADLVPVRPRWFPGSDPWWRAWLRADPAFAWGIKAGVLPFGALVLLLPDGEPGELWFDLSIIFGLGAVIFRLIGLSAAVFARPRAFVPRALRGYPGLLQDLGNDAWLGR